MTRFLDVRSNAVGGCLAASVAINQGTSIDDYRTMELSRLLDDIRGAHVLIGTHGFNVNRHDGIKSLSSWEGLLTLDPPAVFIGLLWPGDSVWAHGLDYPEEPRVADEAGQMIADFVDANFTDAASISFSSHSLGGRVILETISRMTLRVRRAILMAGAIDDDCLNKEFSTAAANIDQISILASKKDEVLSLAFPVGNFFAGILTAGHPWWRAALGHQGPSKPRPANLVPPFEIPDDWKYGHGNYLEVDSPSPAPITGPTNVPKNADPLPENGATGWQEAWSAAFVSTRFR